MKVIIAGSRKNFPWQHADILYGFISTSKFVITEVVSGGAAGADTFGETYAKINKIPIHRFLPDYERYGKTAPLLRNKAMAEYANALIAIWDMQSRGTKYMINCMKNLSKPYEILSIEKLNGIKKVGY